MKLKKLYNSKFSSIPFIGIYEEDDKGRPAIVIPDFADEILETHGDLEVDDYAYLQEESCLIIKFKEELIYE